MGSERGVIIQKMNHLMPVIIVFAVISGILLPASYGVWVSTLFDIPGAVRLSEF
jgi:hypothetical protein